MRNWLELFKSFHQKDIVMCKCDLIGQKGSLLKSMGVGKFANASFQVWFNSDLVYSGWKDSLTKRHLCM